MRNALRNRLNPGTCRRALAGGALAAMGLFGAVGARASVSILLEQPYGKLGKIDPAGHSAIYLDHVCADTLTSLRLCREGELGVVISRYDGIRMGEKKLDWVAMPLIPYLYGVASGREIPATMDRDGEIKVRDAYRRAYLETLAPDLPDGSAPTGNWYELVGSAYDRTIYGFSVKTTQEQDEHLIRLFNDGPNKERYNGLFVNCADFVRVTVNRYYPHAIRRNFIADAGLTSPKGTARALSHYAKKHPEVEFKTFVIPQVPGTLPRSSASKDAAESILKNYAISVPLVILSPATAGVVLVAYVAHGRFAMPKDAIVVDLRDESPGSNALVAPVAAPAPPVAMALSGGTP